MDKSKKVARYCHIINEALLIERVMQETTTSQVIRESLSEVSVIIKIKDVPSMLDEVYSRTIELTKPDNWDFTIDRLLFSDTCQQDLIFRKSIQQVLNVPTICPYCNTVMTIGQIGYFSAKHDDYLCEKCYYLASCF